MNLNPIDFNYQDGLNRFPIQDYIDNAITNDIITSNVYMNDGTSLNEVCYYSDITNIKHLYIKNNKTGGEIRFSTNTSYPQNGSNFGVKISSDGKLFVYHNFNILQPTFSAGFYDVESEILQLKADGISTDIQLTLLEANVVSVQQQFVVLDEIVAGLNINQNEIICQLQTANSFANLKDIRNNATLNSTTESVREAYANYESFTNNAYQNSLTTGATYGLLFGLGGAILGYIQTRQQEDLVKTLVNSNANLTPTQKNSVLNDTVIVASNLSNISNFNLSMSNLVRTQGFINSNIITPQTIPNINTNSITYNGVEISTTLNNYLLKQGGTMSGRINFNYGANVGIPVAGGGGSGERVVLNTNGITGSDYPSAVGVSLNSLWFSAPNNSNFQWYVNGVEKMSLSSTGVLNTNTLQQEGVNITNISSNIVLTQTPNVQKKYMFTGTCSSSMLMPDGITYFAYDIDLRNYTQLKYAPNPNTPYRIFKIKVFFGSVYFGYLTNGKPNVISYEVYMSNESQGGGGGIGSAGLNVCAIGYPENVILNAISPTQLSLVCGDFNFLTVLSRVNGTVFNAIIEDCLF